MILAVIHINEPIGRRQNPMRTRQFALQRLITIRPVAPLAIPYQRRQHTTLLIKPTNRMILRIRNKDSVRRPRDALRPVELRRLRVAAIAREALLPRARDVDNLLRLHVDPVNRIAFAQHQPQVALVIHIQRARTIQRRPFERRTIGRRLLFPSARERADGSPSQVHPPDPVIADIANQQPAVRSQRDAVWLLQLRLHGRTAIAAESRRPIPRHSRDNPGLSIDLADHALRHVGEVQIALTVEDQLVRLVHLSL